MASSSISRTLVADSVGTSVVIRCRRGRGAPINAGIRRCLGVVAVRHRIYEQPRMIGGIVMAASRPPATRLEKLGVFSSGVVRSDPDRKEEQTDSRRKNG